MTIFSDNSGPLMQYANGALVIEDLNPQMKTTWAMSRMEMLIVGLRFIKAAIVR